MRIVLTGATGFIGYHLAKKICAQYEVWCTIRSTSDVSLLEKLPCNMICVDDYDCLYEQMNRIQPELVIHLAGLFLSEHNRNSISEMLSSNISFPTILFDAAYQAGCRKFINTGSCWQNYDGEDYNPVNLYAATKQAVEDILTYYVSAKRAKCITLSIFDSYGPLDQRNKILNIVARMGQGEEIGMSGGEQKMYLCYIDDIVSAFERAIEIVEDISDGEMRKYAVRSDKPYTLKEIITTYLEVSKKDIQIHWGERPYRNREIMDPTGWGEVIPGWEPRYSLQEGLHLYCKENDS